MSTAVAKQSLRELALLGGRPLFAEMLHVGRPSVLDAEAVYARVREAVERRWLSNDGPLVTQLEIECARFLGVKHCLAVANATVGLQLLLQACGVRGRRVILPAWTFIGTAHAVQWEGGLPVFCDVLEDRHTLDPQAVRRVMDAGVGAILGVHLWGGACEIEELQRIAAEYRVPLLFDAAHALGSTYREHRIGRYGAAEVFSLHATKAINGLEGGLVTTEDDALAARIRASRNYGFEGRDVVGGLGVNAKMNEFSAAMALANLGRYQTISSHNRALLAAYGEALRPAGVQLMDIGDAGQSHHYAVLDLGATSPVERDLVLEVLYAENVQARRYFWPGCHRSPPYAAQPQPVLPVTERLSRRVLQLPTGTQLTASDATAIGALIALCIRDAAALRAALGPAGSAQ